MDVVGVGEQAEPSPYYETSLREGEDGPRIVYDVFEQAAVLRVITVRAMRSLTLLAVRCPVLAIADRTVNRLAGQNDSPVK